MPTLASSIVCYLKNIAQIRAINKTINNPIALPTKNFLGVMELLYIYWLGDRDSVTHKILLNFCSTPARHRRACAIRIFPPCQPTLRAACQITGWRFCTLFEFCSYNIVI